MKTQHIYDHQQEPQPSTVQLTATQTKCIRGLLLASKREFNAPQIEEALQWLSNPV